jgi:hypothetical protein
MAAALQAHIAEHFGFKYRQMIEQQLGAAPLPYLKDDEDTIPEEYEVQLSRLVAQASAQLLQQNQAQAAQQQAASSRLKTQLSRCSMQELQIRAAGRSTQSCRKIRPTSLLKQEQFGC